VGDINSGVSLKIGEQCIECLIARYGYLEGDASRNVARLSRVCDCLVFSFVELGRRSRAVMLMLPWQRTTIAGKV
jgi:hypothetical protein